MKPYLADIRTDREADRDIFIERRVKPNLAERTVIVIVQALQAAEALDDAATLRTVQRPIHREESKSRRVEEQVDDFVLG